MVNDFIYTGTSVDMVCNNNNTVTEAERGWFVEDSTKWIIVDVSK